MLRAELKRNLLPLALITLGCLIFLAIIFYLFRSHMETAGWVLIGLLMVAIGVFGIVVTKPKQQNLTDDEFTTAPPAFSETASPSTAPPAYATAAEEEVTPHRQEAATLARPALIGGGVLLACIVLLLLCNLVTTLLPLFTVHETQIVDCREVSLHVENGWRFVSMYSYHLEDAVSGYTEHTDCVMERERFAWVKDKRTPKDKASIDIFAPQPTDDDSFPDLYSPKDGADTGTFAPVPYVEPTRTSFVQPPATQAPPSPTPWFANSPLPTETPPSPSAALPTVTSPSSSASLPTATPPSSSVSSPTNTPVPPSPTPSLIPRTDIEVCEAASNDTYLNTYVQWKGMIVDDPTFEDDGLWFQVSWTNKNPGSACSEAAFFVSYDSDERFFADDMVLVTGTIINTTYEYEDDSGETRYTVVVRANYVEFLDEP